MDRLLGNLYKPIIKTGWVSEIGLNFHAQKLNFRKIFGWVFQDSLIRVVYIKSTETVIHTILEIDSVNSVISLPDGIRFLLYSVSASVGCVYLEWAVGKNEKLESLKLESFTELGKSLAKLERNDRSWQTFGADFRGRLSGRKYLQTLVESVCRLWR